MIVVQQKKPVKTSEIQKEMEIDGINMMHTKNNNQPLG
jgi:hypothetical protein